MKTHEPLTWLTCLALLSPFTTLAAEETAVVKDGHVNVRGQPSLTGEVITQLQKGEKVVVLEEIPGSKTKTNEPPKWARIQMPPKTPVWLYAPFIDPANKSVKVSRLNLRAGPGENFSVVGRLERGAPVSEIRRVEDWMEIETPPGAYAFVAADLLTKLPAGASPPVAKQESPAPVTTPTPAEPAKSPTPESAKVPGPVPKKAETVASTPPSGPVPVPMPVAVPKTEHSTQAPQSQAKVETVVSPSTGPVPHPISPSAAHGETAHAVAVTPKPEPGLQKRVVRREGLVRSTASIQAPTYYELLSPENRKTINYLHADSLGLNLKDYRGRRIVVTGEEGIDPRWPKTPVIEVETLELIP